MNYLTDDGKKLWRNPDTSSDGNALCWHLLVSFQVAYIKDFYLSVDTSKMTESRYLEMSKDTQNIVNKTQPNMKLLMYALQNDRKRLEIAIAVCNAKYLTGYELFIYFKGDEEAIAIRKIKK